MNKRTVLLSLMMFFGLVSFANAQSGPLTYPYVFTFTNTGGPDPRISCNPQNCSASVYVPTYGYGQVFVGVSGYCSSGVYATGSASFAEAFCSANTVMAASAYVPGYTQLYVLATDQAHGYWVFIYAQQLLAEGYIWRQVGSNWNVVSHAGEYSDCFSGGIRQFAQPPQGPC